MKERIGIALLFCGLTGLMACATSASHKPQWIEQKGAFMRQTNEIQDCLGSTGYHNIGPQGEGFARSQASAAARAELSKQILSRIESQSKEWTQELQSASSTHAEGMSELAWKVIGKQISVRGSEIYASHVNNNTVYALAILCVSKEELGDIVAQAGTKANLDANTMEAIRQKAAQALSRFE